MVLTACPAPSTPPPPASLSLSPTTLTLTAGDSAKTFNATLTNSSAIVTWSLAGPGTLSATTGPSIQYTPPENLSDSSTASLVASAAGINRSAQITINPKPRLTITPTNPTLSAGGTSIEFTAQLEHLSGTVTWSLSGPGTLEGTSGTTVRYTPPTTLPSTSSATLTASVDSTSASTSIGLTPSQTGLSLSPLSATLNAGDPALSFNATLSGSSDPITWTLNGPGTINTTTGTTVQYTPPASINTQTVVSLSASAAGIERTAQITVRPKPKLEVSITSPTGTVFVRENVTVQINVSGGTPDGVELLKDGSPLATLVPPYQYTWNVTNEPERSYTLSARAKQGEVTYTTSTVLTVNVDRTPPTIADRTPAPNATDVPRNSPISVVFSEAIDPTSLTDSSVYLYRSGGGPISRTLQLSGDGRTLIISPTTNYDPPSYFSLSLNGLRDRAGNALTYAYWNWTVPGWLQLSRFDYTSGENCGQIKMDASNNPVALCTITTGGVMRGYVKRYRNNTWETLGGGAFNTDINKSIVYSDVRYAHSISWSLKSDGSPVVAWVESGANTNLVYVKELRGNTWFLLSGPLNISLAQTTYPPTETALALAANDTPVVSFVEGRSVYVRRFNGGSWSIFGNSFVPGSEVVNYTAPQRPKLAISSAGDIHAFWWNFYGAYYTEIRHRKWQVSTSEWVSQGGFSNYGISSQYNMFFDASNTLYAQLQNATDNNFVFKISLNAFQNNAWQGIRDISDLGKSTNPPGVTSDSSGTQYFVFAQSKNGYPNYSGYDILVRSLTGSTLSTLGEPLETNYSNTISAASQVGIVLDGSNTPVVALSSGTQFTLKRFNR
jgi:hypothetical protein